MRDVLITKFLRAADQRFRAAGLLAASDMYLDATYLAGYTAEIALEALILSSTPVSKREQVFESEFKGSKAHDFEYLLSKLRQRGVRIVPKIRRALLRISNWSTDMRYEAGHKRYSEVHEFLNAVKEIQAWVEKQIA